ncbi:MAG TPA: YbaB/EbfC family nucleoid-associated protein [Pilimelia sp.]|nr:YbaB/EbfC family nucleoid-associated protein [Pilimelia sp.]
MRHGGDGDANGGLAARAEDSYARLLRTREAVDVLREELASMRVSVTSPDQSVRATVDARGRLVDLRLEAGRCVGVDPAILARLITATAAEAAARATAQVRAQVAARLPDAPAAPDLVAGGDPTALLDRYRAGGGA